MGKHLDRLGGNGTGRIFVIEPQPDGTFQIWEECDHYFAEEFTAEELRELANEIIELSHQGQRGAAE